MGDDPWLGELPPRVGSAVVRVDAQRWAVVLAEVFDFSERERAGVLLTRAASSDDGPVLAVIGWMPVPDQYVIDSAHGLAYDGRFNLRVAEAAQSLDAGAVLVHAHPGKALPRPSSTDAERGAAFLAFMRRRRPDAPHGLLVVADDTLTGVIDEPAGARDVERLVSVGLPTREWLREPRRPAVVDDDDRQLLAIGAAAQDKLGEATIAVIGNSGGGSHATQQLIHAGVGTLIVVDHDIVSRTNLRRLVGAVASDVDTTEKIEIARRTAAAVRPAMNVRTFNEPFPSATTLAALRTADVIVGCVDGWDTRDDLNTFALTHRIPYVDIGVAIAPPTGTLGMRVGGQVALVLPGGPCLRCMGLVTDARVEASRKQRQGYADQQPEPQVVSLNGTLASEAVTATLMLLAGDDRLVPYRRYAYPPGKLVEVGAKPRAGCPSCTASYLDHEPAPPSQDTPQRATLIERIVGRLMLALDRLRRD